MGNGLGRVRPLSVGVRQFFCEILRMNMYIFAAFWRLFVEIFSPSVFLLEGAIAPFYCPLPP